MSDITSATSAAASYAAQSASFPSSSLQNSKVSDSGQVSSAGSLSAYDANAASAQSYSISASVESFSLLVVQEIRDTNPGGSNNHNPFEDAAAVPNVALKILEDALAASDDAAGADGDNDDGKNDGPAQAPGQVPADAPNPRQVQASYSVSVVEVTSTSFEVSVSV